MSEEQEEILDAEIQDDPSEEVEKEDTLEEDESDELNAKLEEAYNNQKIRAEKAETESKDLKRKIEALEKQLSPADEEGESQDESKPQSGQIDQIREEILQSQGFSEDEIARAKRVAAVEDITVIEATEHEMFKDWKAKKDAEAKDKEAELGASTGASRARPKKGFSTTNLSEEEHKALFKKQVGQ
jgi:hypothetical protein